MSPVEERLRELNEGGALVLPPPAGGATVERLRALRRLAATEDLSVARLAEAHTDAVAILAEAGRALPHPADGSDLALAGVWASRFGGQDLRAERTASGWHLAGRLAFCSGATLLDLALVDAQLPDGQRQLFVVPLRDGGLAVESSRWHVTALAATATASVSFDLDVAEEAAVGEPGFYLERPGFWHGAIGVAACWAGGARAVHEATLRHAPTDRPHAAANVGRTAGECWAMEAILDRAGADIDAVPSAVDLAYALQLRQLVAAACDRVLSASRRATGPGPYVFDDRHAQRIDDLALYIEQQHHEADLAEVGDDALRRDRRP